MSFLIPDFSLVRYARIKIFPVERIRGCGMNCEFCTVKGKPRFASAERLLEQDRWSRRDPQGPAVLHRRRPVRTAAGRDPAALPHAARVPAAHRQKAGNTVQIRLDKAKDPELLAAMRRPGIKYVAIGFESPIAEELKAMNKAT